MMDGEELGGLSQVDKGIFLNIFICSPLNIQHASYLLLSSAIPTFLLHVKSIKLNLSAPLMFNFKVIFVVFSL